MYIWNISSQGLLQATPGFSLSMWYSQPYPPFYEIMKNQILIFNQVITLKVMKTIHVHVSYYILETKSITKLHKIHDLSSNIPLFLHFTLFSIYAFSSSRSYIIWFIDKHDSPTQSSNVLNWSYGYLEYF